MIDQQGIVVWRSKCATDPDAIAAAIRQHAPRVVRAGLETGLLSNFLTRALRARGVPIVCLDARHAKAALRVQINKTDANDAHGLAQVVRTGWFREIAVKSMDAQSLRLLLVARAQLVSQRQAIANTLRGLLKAFGHVVRKGAGGPFAGRVREVCAGNPALCAIAEPMLAVWQSLRERLGQDHCAPLRGGLRPVLTQSPRGARNVHGPGQKTMLQDEQKAHFWLANIPAIKERRNGHFSRTKKLHLRLAKPLLHSLTHTTRGGEADGRNFANISIVYDGQILGVCLSRGRRRRRLLDQEDLLRH